ncbi:UDP-glycosyltransferase [Ladona fulva]|uniref:UDP-glucuronosyltransferase n=1 Tax=Ladona fulva TaxID=123851 RepID=A0A8K0NXB0_LADFU|nr:UDP-glycosyltransferase [Ladona fulva]
MIAMWSKWALPAIILVFILQPQASNSANILGLFPFASSSHNNMYNTIIKALLEKGYNVTVATSKPLDTTLPNYKHIDFMELTNKYLSIFNSETKPVGVIELMSKTIWMNDDICNQTLFHPDIKRLLNPSKNAEHFDAILSTTFMSECFFGFAHIYKAPLVLISPTAPLSITYNSLGIIGLPSFVSNMMTGYTDHMTFPQRIINSLVTFGHTVVYEALITRNIDTLMKEVYGEEIPPFSEIKKSVSLVLVNHHFSLNGGRPLSPSIVEVGGLHIKPPKELPKDIKEFMDGAGEDGIIYVSLGSILRSANFPVKVRDAFIGAFSQLKQRILWKWEGDSPLPGQTKNIRLEKWVPQQDVLAHPNVKLFITHGGLLSMQEAVTRGVPLIGIPFFGDQYYNLARAAELQIGVKLDALNITRESLLEAMRKVLENPMYQTNMKAMMTIVKDQKEHPLERAIYWIEYVMRHKEAKHMRLASADLNWFQLYMLDVLLVLIVIPMVVFLIIAIITVKIVKKCCNSKRKRGESTKKNQ